METEVLYICIIKLCAFIIVFYHDIISNYNALRAMKIYLFYFEMKIFIFAY